MCRINVSTTIPRLVPDIEGGYSERDGEGEEEGAEGLVLTYSISWMIVQFIKRFRWQILCEYQFH